MSKRRKIINTANIDKPIDPNDRLLKALIQEKGSSPERIIKGSVGAAETLQEGSVDNIGLPTSESFAASGIDKLHDLRAERQSAWSQWGNGVVKFFGKTGTALLGGTIGTLYGIGDSISSGSFQNFSDNEFQRMLDNWNEYMDVNLPNYYTQKEQDYNLLRSLGTSNFWANDVLGGLSFTAGAILTELSAAGLTGLTGGAASPILAGTTAKNISQAAKLLKKFSRNAKLVEDIKKTGTFARQLVTGSFYEAAVETRHFKDSAKEQYLQNLGKKETDLTVQERALMEDRINTLANGVFAANAALVSFSNFVSLGKTFDMGLKKANVGKINKIKSDIVSSNAFTSAYKTYSKSKNAALATSAFMKPLLSEGLVEEGGQSVIQNSTLGYVAKKYSKDGNDNTYDLFQSFGDGLKETYGTKEGWKEIGVGMIIGALGFPNINYRKGDKNSIWQGGSYGSLQDYRETQDRTDSLVDWMNKSDVTESTKAVWENTARQFESFQELENAEGNTFEMKNAEDDIFFSYVSSRIKGGYYSDISEEITDSISQLSPEEFGKMFGYSDTTVKNLEQRKQEVVTKAVQQAEQINDSLEQAKKLNYTESEDVELGLAHSIYSAKQTEARKDALIEQVSNTVGDIDSRELKNVLRANNRIKFKRNWLNTYKKELKQHQTVKKQLNDELQYRESLKPSEVAKLEKSSNKIETLEKKISKQESEITTLIKKEASERKTPLTGTAGEIKNLLKRNIEIEDKLQKHYDKDPINKKDTQKLIEDLEKLEQRENLFVEQYNLLASTPKAQEQFQDDLKAVRDMLMQSYGNRGKVSTPISTSEDTFLEDDSVNEAFNQFKNKVKETVQSIPNINSNNLTLKIPALQSRIKVLQDAIKSAEESIKVGTEIDDLYNMFIENAKEEIKNLKETITSLTQELTKQENLPKGQIIHRSDEYTQMFSAFETDINWITDPSADIINNTSIKVVDFEGGGNYIETKGNDGLTSIQTGITKGPNKGKAVQVIYKGQVIGSLLDPNRFVLSSTKQPLDILGNANHLKILNPRFVRGNTLTPEGEKMREVFKGLNNVWENTIYKGETSISNEELKKLFWINKTNSVSRSNTKPSISEYISRNPQYQVKYKYTNPLFDNEIEREGVIIVEQRATPLYFLKTTSEIIPIEIQEEIEVVQKLEKEALGKKLTKDKLGNNYVILHNLEKPIILDTRSPIDESLMEDVDDKESVFSLLKDALDSLSGDINFEGKKAVVKQVIGTKKAGNFISLLDGKKLNANIGVVRFIDAKQPTLRITFSNGNISHSINLDYQIKNDVIQIKSFGKYKNISWSTLQEIVNSRFSEKNKGRDKYIPQELHDVKLGNLLQRVIPSGEEANIEDYNNLLLNYTINAGLHFRPKKVKASISKPSTFFEQYQQYVLDQENEHVLKAIKTKLENNELLIQNRPDKKLDEKQRSFIISLIDEKIGKPTAAENEFLAALKPTKKDEVKEEPTLVVEDLKSKLNALGNLYNHVRRKGGTEEVYQQEKHKYKSNLDVLPESYEGVVEEMQRLKSLLPKKNKPVFSVSQQSTTKYIDINRAKQTLKRLLPSFIKVEDISKILNNIENSGITWGAFANNVVYLNKYAEEGTQYHEAFHAVFRTLLTDIQINRYYRHARNKWGKPSKEDLNNIKHSSSAYLEFSDAQLENLWYEEKMADEFKNYGLKRQEESWLRKLFRTIKNLFKWLSKDKSELDLLLSDIYSGKFSNSPKKYNVFRTSSPVFSLMKFESYGGDEVSGFFNRQISDRIINTIARNVIKNNTSVEKEIDNMAERYVLENWEEELNAVEEKNFDKYNEIINELETRRRALEFNPIGENPNHKLIQKSVNQIIRLYNSEELEDLHLSENNEDAVSFDKSPTEIGGFSSLSKQMKQYIGFTPFYIDEFGIGDFVNLDFSQDKFELSSDGIKIYNGLSRVLVDVPKSDMLKVAYYFAENNQNAATWVDTLFNDIRNDLDTNIPDSELIELPYSKLSESNFYNMFVNAFYKTNMQYMTLLVDPISGTFNIFNANQRDVKHQQFEEWKKSFRSLNINQAGVKNVLDEIESKLNSFKSVLELNSYTESIQELFNRIGINLSSGYVETSIINKHKYAIEGKLNSDEQLTDSDNIYFSDLLNKVNSFDVEYFDSETITALKEANDRSKNNEFGFFVEIDGDATTGAVGRLLKLADANSVFDESVGKSTFQNAEGKTIYSHINPSYYTEESKKWNNRKELISSINENDWDKALNLLKAENFDPYNAEMLLQVLWNNPLIRGLDSEETNYKLIDSIFSNLRLLMVDGIRTTNLLNNKETVYGPVQSNAQAFKRLDQRGKALLNLLLFANSSSTFNKKGGFESRLFNVGVNAEKSSNYIVQLPIHNFASYSEDAVKLSKTGYAWYTNLFKQEYDRIRKINKEKEDSDIKIKNYNEGRLEGLEFYHFFNLPNIEYYKEKALKDKELAEEDINKLQSDLDVFANSQFEEYLSVLSSPSVNIIEKIIDTAEPTGEVSFDNKLLPKEYLSDNKIDMDKVSNFFFNDYLNTYAYTALLDGDYAMNYKYKYDTDEQGNRSVVGIDTTDPVKRNSGKVAAGPDMGEGTTKIAVVESIEEFINENGIVGKIDRTDAQTYGTINWYINYLKATGKYVKPVKRIIKKFLRGVPISDNDYLILKRYNADIRPRKIVQRDMTNYIKTSLHTLTRNLTSVRNGSIKDLNTLWDRYDSHMENNELDSAQEVLSSIQNMWSPIPGRESLHNLLNKMEKENIGLVTFDSSVKTSRRNVGSVKAGEWELEPYEIDNSTIREQVSTDANKSKIIDSTQKLQLLWSEQDRNTDVVFDGRSMKLGKVIDAYEKFLGMRVKRGTETMRNSIIKNGKPQYEKLYRSIKNSLEASQSDPYLSELFSLDESGQPAYNWNFPAIEKKFQSMYLSYVSKQTLSHKAPGRKYTLVSDYGFEVMRDSSGNVITVEQYRKNPVSVTTSRLKHRVLDADGNYYSEVLVPKSVLNTFGLNIGETFTIPDHLAKQMGVRIPTQDNHSMINIKIVDTIPNEYSNVVIMPYEIVLLSGADFDIDSLFTRVYDNFRDYDSENRAFGDYRKEQTQHNVLQTAFEEFVIDKYKNNKDFRQTVNEIIDNDGLNIVKENKETISSIEERLEEYKETSAELREALENSKYYLSLGTLTELGGRFNLEHIVTNKRSIIRKALVKQYREAKNKRKQLSILKKEGKEIIKQLNLETLFYSQEAALKIHKLPSTLGEFRKSEIGISALKNSKAESITDINPITTGELNNLLLSLEFPLLHNKSNENISATPATMTVFKDLVKKLQDKGIVDNTEALDIHSPSSKSKASSSIDIGSQGIGPVALFNVVFQRLHQAGIKLSEEVNKDGSRKFPQILGQYDNFSNRKENAAIVNTNGKRINDLLSSILSAMTDNAKEQLAAKFNLSIDTLGPSLLMIGMGVPFNKVMLFMKQPVIQNVMNLLIRSKSGIKTKEEQKSFTVGADSMKNIVESAKTLVSKGKDIQYVDVELTEDLLTKSLKGELTEPEFIALQNKVASEFLIAKEYSENIRHLSRIFSLIKGMNSSWSENENIEESLKELGLIIKGDSWNNIKFESANISVPFNILDVINKSELIKNNLKTYHLINKDSKRFFITQTDWFKSAKDALANNLKERAFDFEKNRRDFKEQLLGYLTVKAYRHSNNPSISIGSLFDNTMIKSINALKQTEEFKNNSLINFLKEGTTDYTKKENHIFAGNVFYKVLGNTRTKSDPDYVESLMSGYKALVFSSNPIAQKLGQDLFYYVLVKDNFQFKNNSIIRQIAPYFLGKAMSSLTDVQNTLSNNKGFEKVFGLSEQELMTEFSELFLRYSENSFKLKGNKLSALLKDTVQREGNRKDTRFNYPVFFDNNAQELTVNIFAGTAKFLKDNLDIISKGSENTKIFNTFSTGEGVEVSFPLFIKLDKMLLKLKAYQQNFTAKKPSLNNSGHEAIYEIVNPVGTREILPYAFTNNEWDAWILNNASKKVATEQEPVTDIEQEVISSLLGPTKHEGEITTKDAFISALTKDIDKEAFLNALLKKQEFSKMNSISKDNATVILNGLQLKFGIPWKFDSSLDVLGMYDPNKNMVLINPNKMTIETLFHEFAHPFIQVVKQQNRTLYRQLARNVKDIVEEIRDKYTPFYKEQGLTDKQIEDALVEEAIVTSLGLYAGSETISKGLTKVIDKFLSFVKDIINKILGSNVLQVESLPADTSLRDLAKLLTDNSVVNLKDINNLSINMLNFQKGNCT